MLFESGCGSLSTSCSPNNHLAIVHHVDIPGVGSSCTGSSENALVQEVTWGIRKIREFRKVLVTISLPVVITNLYRV